MQKILDLFLKNNIIRLCEILKNIISQSVDEAILNVYSVLSEEKERFNYE